MPLTPEARFERRVLLLMALVQFINIWDFMIVMPMGPDFAHALGIDLGHIGWIAGSYSISASIIGIFSARYLDRFDRRSVLILTLSGLVVATMAMTLASTLAELIIVRAVTGLFGGVMIASSMAIISDVFPPQRRGEAVGKVFGSFSVASVIGVPLGLEIASRMGWWSPFVVISVMAALTVVMVVASLPPMRGHLVPAPEGQPPFFASLRLNPATVPALLMTAFGLFASFLIIPNISAHVQQNMGYPREHLGMLYLVGGCAAFFSMRYVGRKSDQIGYARMAMYATAGLWLALFVGFYAQIQAVPILAVFVLFMITMSTRNVTINALISKIPKPHERAGFMALVSSMQNLMAGLGSLAGTLLLSQGGDNRLLGMDHVALLAIVFFGISTCIMFRIEKIVRRTQESNERQV
jgi:predicted MFS family arabinose efflux permease